MLDVIYLVATFAIFALVALIAKAIERMGPRAEGSAPHEATGRGERA